MKRTAKTTVPGISLHISLTVARCEHADHERRVRYTLGDGCRTGEDIVIWRWRHRRGADVTFDGCRLPPGTWRLLQACIDAGLKISPELESETVRRFVDQVREQHREWRAPESGKLLALITTLSNRRRLMRILERERREAHPGIPDLFLFKRRPDGTPFAGRFVEVKRPDERVSPEQQEEITFLRGLGLKAGVARLRYARRDTRAPR